MRLLFLLFIPLVHGIITEQQIRDEVEGCFNEAFGFNTRMVNQYVEASIIITQLEECLKRDPLYIQQTDYIENVLRTDIQYLQSNVTLLQAKQRDYEQMYELFLNHAFYALKNVYDLVLRQDTVAASLLSSFDTFDWTAVDHDVEMGQEWSVTKELRESGTQLTTIASYVSGIVSSDVARAVTTAGQVRLTYEEYQEASKELTLARNSIRSGQQIIVQMVKDWLKTITV